MTDWPLIAGALWLGILTSISPCPLATNIAAVAYLARRSDRRLAVARSCGAYVAGRMAAYTGLAMVLAAGLLSAPAVAEWLRNRPGGLIGPGLIVLGMVVAGWLPLRVPGFGGINALGTRLAGAGMAGEFLMGALFALALCPVSAALFFGGLIPGVVRSGSTFVLPVVYGAGTGIPVVAAVLIVAGGAGLAGERLARLSNAGLNLQRATGWVLTAAGGWLTVRDILM